MVVGMKTGETQMTPTQTAILTTLAKIQRSQRGRKVLPASVVDCYDWRSTSGLLTRGYLEMPYHGEYRVTDAGMAAV